MEVAAGQIMKSPRERSTFIPAVLLVVVVGFLLFLWIAIAQVLRVSVNEYLKVEVGQFQHNDVGVVRLKQAGRFLSGFDELLNRFPFAAHEIQEGLLNPTFTLRRPGHHQFYGPGWLDQRAVREIAETVMLQA